MNANKMNQYFPTRKSLVLGSFIWGILVGTLAVTGYFLLIEINLIAIIIIIAVYVPTIVILYIVWFKTGYFVNKESLIIKIGPYIERDIDIVDIISLKRSYSLLASPANSLKRLKIHYQGGIILISPVRENEFIKLLSDLNPRIRIDIQE